MRLLCIVSITAFLLAACSDDTVKPTPDTKPVVSPDKGVTAADKPAATKEASAPMEASTKKDGSTAKVDLPAGPWNCATVGECQKTCGIDMTCLNNCKAKGCAGAQTATDALWTCVTAKCLLKCVTGFNADCLACIAADCKTEYDACNAQKC